MLKEIKQEQKDQNTKLEDIRVNVSKNTIDLQHHIKRTELAENRLELLHHNTTVTDTKLTEVTSKLKGAGIFLTILLSIASVVGGILIFFK